MIKLVKHGDYRLIETKNLTKVLFLNRRSIYAWVNTQDIGEILVTSHKTPGTDYVLATGKFRLYKVDNEEPKITDAWHLELSVGDGLWQGYLLPTGFPNNKKKRNRIIPTSEVITKVRTSMLDSLAE